MLVEVAVSSRNTSRAGSNMPCSRIQRRRARATSARSCSAARRLFFDADLVALKEAPHRAATTGDPSLVHRGDDFIERQIRLPSNQRKQKRRVRFQRRDAAPLGLGAMLPVACRRCIHLIAELGLTSNQSAASRRDAPDSTASTTRARNSKEHGFGIDPPSKPESMPARFNYPSLPGNPDSTQPKSALSASPEADCGKQK